MKKTQRTFLKKISAAFGAGVLWLGISATTAAAQTETAPERPLGLWPRNTSAYLAARQPMPLWPQLPASVNGASQDLTLVMTFPAGFKIVAWGKSKEFALLPKPLVVPSAVQEAQSDAQKVVYRLTIPKSELPARTAFGRLALMVDAGPNAPGQYKAQMAIEGRAETAEVLLTVLEPLRGKRPRRLQVGAYNYNGLIDEAWLKASEQAVLNAGINLIWDMKALREPATSDEYKNALSARLAPQGVDAGVLWFWKSFAAELEKTYPESVRVDAAGKADPQNGIASAWVIANREKVMPILEANLKAIFDAGLYRSFVLDHEERALSRDGKAAEGDVYNPGTVEAFAQFAGLEKVPPRDAAYIAEHHAEKWVDYRTWQSAQLSSMVADALQNVNPLASYGLYSGYEYAPPLEGRSHSAYSVDWKLMAEQGKVQFGSAGYYGSAADLRNTAAALGDKPYAPAEMYVVNFLSTTQTLPEPDRFALRLLAGVLDGGGRGGVNLWYLPVLDAGAYWATGEVSRVLADAEQFLLDGKRVDEQLNLPREIDSANVFAYQLGEQRLVIVLNRSATQTVNFRAAWKEKIYLPDTVEIVSGRRLGNAPLLETTLKPNSFAAFLTISDGN